MNKKSKKFVLVFGKIITGIFLAADAMAGIPVVNDIIVSDVTTRSFCVIWNASEASMPDLKIFSDPEGLFPVTGITITPQPVKNGSLFIQTQAENNGVMKVKVKELTPDTVYYYQIVTTSKASSDITVTPPAGALPSVVTQSLTVRTVTGSDEVPFSNDLITMDCFFPDGATPAEGTLLVGQIAGSDYPVSGFVGDGIQAPEAYVDLNNIFSSITRRNMQVFGGESLTLTQYLGIQGLKSVVHRLPDNSQMSQFKFPEQASCYGDFDTDSDVDGDDLFVFISEFNVCTSNCAADHEPDSDVDSHDLVQFAAQFGKNVCP